MPDAVAAPTSLPEFRHLKLALITGGIAMLIIPANFVLWLALGDSKSLDRDTSAGIVTAVALLQTVLATTSFVYALKIVFHRGGRFRVGAGFISLSSLAVGLGGLLGALLAQVTKDGINLVGGAWGRPLRLRGRVLHPELSRGSNWARGDRPDSRALDSATRRALEALWLHDAQKEHASVPAFSRVSWMLAAAGAPAELLAGAHRAALEEVDHAQRCFALAAGYGDSAHEAMPMPELLVGGFETRGDVHALLAVESLKDGCLLEDFNADVAAACAHECVEPAVRDVLERIAREERSHAELSWSILQWALEAGRPSVRSDVERALAALGEVARPTAASALLLPIVEAADAQALRAHGRLPDAEWALLWEIRLTETFARARSLVSTRRAAA